MSSMTIFNITAVENMLYASKQAFRDNRQRIAQILRTKIATWADLTDCCQATTNLIPPTTIACSKCGKTIKNG